MKKILLVTLLLVLGQFTVKAQMSDQQVIDYAKYALSQGRDQKAIAKDLLSSGVSQTQAERIRASIVSGQQSTAANLVDQNLETRTEDSIARDEYANTVANDALPEDLTSERQIFGHNIFNSRNLSFEPNDNAATPQDYRIGPGDELLIEIWGYNEASMSKVLSPEGSISINQVGRVQLSGLTIAEATKKITQVLSKKYAGLEGSQSSVSVTLGRVRSIRVNIMGEVRVPGSYRLSSFSTVFHALYKANGVTQNGSLRGIKVIRAGQQVAEVDVYGYIFDGKSDSDISLEEGDIIIVPPYISLVSIEGNIKRPAIYELKEDETLQTIIEYTGGFSNAAYEDHIKVVRNTNMEREIFTVNKADFDSFNLLDGDMVTVGGTYDRFCNMAEIRGYVYRPDMYEINDEVSTVKQLIEKAGGLKEDAFLDRAILLREKDDFSVESMAFNIGELLNNNNNNDIPLKPNDVIVISGIYELNDRGTLTINGYVNHPGTFVFTDNTTIEDLILRAGGLVEGASLSKVDVARRIVDTKSLVYKDTLATVFSLPISDGFKIEGGDKFLLEPNDVVSVRRSPGYREKKYVDVSGEVNFPGRYLILHQGETITEIIERAGGLTNQADIDGIRLKRNGRRDNISSQISAVVRKNSQHDSVRVDQLNVESSYLVAVDMREAFRNPKSYADVIMVEDDMINVPELDNTVKVLGEVMFPVAVSYVKNKPVSYYISAAGGFSQNAKRTKAYVVYSNGSAAKTTFGNAQIRPGSIIIVPTKPERKPMQYGEIAAISTAGSSMLSLVTIIASMFK